jgi:hypothetical protein
MWIFTQDGFVSAVRHTDKPDHLMVRSRDYQSLIGLSNASKQQITKTPTADYPYRVTVKDDKFNNWLTDSVTQLEYSNFKSQVAVTRGKGYVNALHHVWDIMHDVEDKGARKNTA